MVKFRTVILMLTWSIVIYLLAWHWNGWFIATMARHQIIQLPAMFLSGVLPTMFLTKNRMRCVSTSIATLIIVMTSVLFWMLPRSVDMAVLNPGINRIMHANMIVAGLLSVIALRGTIFEVKVIFLGMMTAMLLVAGFSLRVFDMLLCSSFNIWQQKETGLYLIIIGTGLFIANVIVLFSGLRKP